MCYDRDSFQKEGAGHENELQHKKINHSKIYHMIYRELKGVSKQEIMRRLGLSLPTVTQKLEELQAEGLVQDAGAADSTGGRRARAFSIQSERPNSAKSAGSYWALYRVTRFAPE